jgi:hypothetical protein
MGIADIFGKVASGIQKAAGYVNKFAPVISTIAGSIPTPATQGIAQIANAAQGLSSAVTQPNGLPTQTNQPGAAPAQSAPVQAGIPAGTAPPPTAPIM